ncbi:MAG: GntR family transcriptional regulator [Proteobacteria bacterium]|jgi:GntR family transcriptional regulator|nr:GntR family transcriptional regulator [Pseudomonadota bacterium]
MNTLAPAPVPDSAASATTPLEAAPAPTAPLPLFAQIKARLRQDILEKRLTAGQKLPSEAKLQAAFGVSRITVRQALAELQTEGLIETFNGKGSFVTRPADAPRLGMLAGYHDFMRAHGRETGGRILSARTGPAPPHVARALRLPAGQPVSAVRTVRTANGIPVSYALLYYEPTQGRELLAERVHQEDAMTLLETELGFRLEFTQISATAVPAGRRHGVLLGVPADTPLLRMRFIPHDLTGQALIYAEVWFRPDQFTYRAVVRR